MVAKIGEDSIYNKDRNTDKRLLSSKRGEQNNEVVRKEHSKNGYQNWLQQILRRHEHA